MYSDNLWQNLVAFPSRHVDIRIRIYDLGIETKNSKSR